MMLKDKVAIVTGAGVGIGVEYSKRLAAEGAKVVCTDIQGGPAQETAEGIVAAGGDAIGFKTDVASKADTDAMAVRAQDQYDRIDILVNNAALFTALPEGPFDELTEENWDRCMEVNLKGVWNCIRSVFPVMKKQRYGKIINISSVTWMMGRPYRLDYVTSKAGVVGMTKVWARELGRHNIRVNAVAPGFILTEMVKQMPEKILENMVARTPIGRMGEPRDVANAYLFLASEGASFISGAVLRVDGGIVIGT